jgi:hypothetical protein
MVYKLAIGATVAAAYKYAWVQLGVLALSEVVYMLLIAALKPHDRPARNGFEIGLGVLRLANLGLLCASVSGVPLPEATRSGMETASIVLQLLVVISMGLVMMGNLLVMLIRWLWAPASGPVDPAIQDKLVVGGKESATEREEIEASAEMTTEVPAPRAVKSKSSARLV